MAVQDAAWSARGQQQRKCAECACREIDQIISLNRGRVRFQSPLLLPPLLYRPFPRPRKPQSTSITPVVRGIFSTRRRSNYCTSRVPLSLSLSLPLFLPLPYFPRMSRVTRLFCKHSYEYVRTHRRRGRPIDRGGLSKAFFTFCRMCSRRIALAEKLREIWRASSNGGLLVDHRRILRSENSSLENGLIFLIESNEKKIDLASSRPSLIPRSRNRIKETTGGADISRNYVGFIHGVSFPLDFQVGSPFLDRIQRSRDRAHEKFPRIQKRRKSIAVTFERSLSLCQVPR